MNKIRNISLYFLLCLFITFNSISCKTLESLTIPEEERKIIVEAPELQNLPHNILQEGKIINLKDEKKISKNQYDITIQRSNYFRWPFRIIPAINNTKENLNIGYNETSTKIALTYDEYVEHTYKVNEETNSISPDKDSKNEWFITHIKIHGDKNKYKFNSIGPARALFFFSQSHFDSARYTKDMLPIELTNFSINNNHYKITITKFPIIFPALVVDTADKIATYKEDEIKRQHRALAGMINEDNQIYLIQDKDGKILASFNSSGYKIYNQQKTNPDDFVIVIGIYSQIIEILKNYY